MKKKLKLAIAKFNSKEFFACHELLEDLWFASKPGINKDLYQGLLHFTVAFHHMIDKKNARGAKLQLKKCVERLENCRNTFQGIDINQIIVSARSYLKMSVSEMMKNINAPKIRTY